MVKPIPAAHHSMRGRRPTRSMMKIAMMLSRVSHGPLRTPRARNVRGEEVASSVDTSKYSGHLGTDTHVVKNRSQVVGDQASFD